MSKIEPCHPTDLEAITTLLEIAAIMLTPTPGARFSLDQLLAQAHEIGGPECLIAERDVRIVLPFHPFIKKRQGLYYLKP